MMAVFSLERIGIYSLIRGNHPNLGMLLIQDSKCLWPTLMFIYPAYGTGDIISSLCMFIFAYKNKLVCSISKFIMSHLL